MVKDGRTTTGKPEIADGGTHLGHRVADGRPRHIPADGPDHVLEDLPVLTAVDRRDVRADQLDPVFLQHAPLVQRDRGVQRGLPAEGGQHGVHREAAGLLVGQHLLHELGVDRLHVGGVREFRVGHDRRGVGVDQGYPDALVPQHPACLGPGVVELARLPDDDRAGPDDQDVLDVGAAWHQAVTFRLVSAASAAPLRSHDLPRLFFSSHHQVDEPVEQVPGVMRPGRRLGMELHRERQPVKAFQALDDAVVQAAEGDLHPAELGVGHLVQRCVDREPVIVRGHQHPPGAVIAHRLVDPVVPELQLVRAETQCPAEDLVAEADAEQRDPAGQHGPGELDDLIRGGRIPRPVGQEYPVHAKGFDLGDADGRGQHMGPDAAGREHPRGVRLDAEVDRGDGEDLLALGRNRVPVRGGHLSGQVGARPSTGLHPDLRPDMLPAHRRSPIPEKIPQRIAPAVRRCRVSARVSTPEIPTTP